MVADTPRGADPGVVADLGRYIATIRMYLGLRLARACVGGGIALGKLGDRIASAVVRDIKSRGGDVLRVNIPLGRRDASAPQDGGQTKKGD